MQKMKQILFILLISTTSTSCQKEIKAKFEIANKTDLIIDSINLKSYDHNQTSDYLKLQPGESKIYLMDMTDLPKVDGNYLLTYKIDKIKMYERFGYFTNGYPLEDITIIIIEFDTVIID